MKLGKMVRLLATCVAVGLAGCSTLEGEFFGAGNGDEAAKLTRYEQGKFYLAAGQYGLAIEEFRSALTFEPGSIEALNALGAAYDRVGRFDLAERYYRRALVHDRNSAQTLNNLGYSYLMQNRYDLAVAFLREADLQNARNGVVSGNRHIAESALAELDIAHARYMAGLGNAQQVQAAKVVSSRAFGPLAPPRGPWIERTTAEIQTLVTSPQVAFAGAAANAGIDPALGTTHGTPDHKLGFLPAPVETVAFTGVRASQEGDSASEIFGTPLSVGLIRPQFTDSMPADRAPRLELSNGTGRLGMAARLKGYLGEQEITTGRLTNAKHFNHMLTTVYYREGWRDFAQRIAALLPAEVSLRLVRDQRSDIRVELGGDLLDFDQELFFARRRSSFLVS